MVGVDEEGGSGAVDRVYGGILQALEEQRMAPGQRLVEADLAQRFGVGRNAVREAMQRLSSRGVVDLTRNRSASIRQLDRIETLDILDVAAAMTALAARLAAARFDPDVHTQMLTAVMAQLADDAALQDLRGFSQTRRGFYRALLSIGGSKELQRLFPAISVHIIFSQFRSPRLDALRQADYRLIGEAILAKDVAGAEAAGRAHVERVRAIIDSPDLD